MRSWKSSVPYIVGLLLVAFLIFSTYPAMHREAQLSHHGVHVVGIVLGKDCSRSRQQLIDYKFFADGTEIHGRGMPGNGNRSCDAFQIGDQVFITYQSDDASVNVPDREVESHPFIVPLTCIAFFTVIIWSGGKKSSRNKKSKRGRKKVVN